MKRALNTIIRMADFILPALVWPAAWILKFVRRLGVHRLPLCRKTLLAVGVFPVRNHYFEPQFDFRSKLRPFSEDRQLPGIAWNVDGQLNFLDSLRFADELNWSEEGGELGFRFDNGAFESGDAEYWYQVIRLTKPRRLIEIGSGHSTLMARKALRRNQAEDPAYRCEHICVEPYEMPWLERSGVRVVRKRVEELDRQFFAELESGDILFIDSSHVIRPQGDVLFEYLEVLPSLKEGVIVHVHDIFSPKNYPLSWLEGEVRLWNEQYLVEAFMSHNPTWQIVGALNFLRHHHFERLKTVAPFLTEDREPGSFYIRRVA
jgi:hypothetical protein